jgi:hypothetical protein
MLFWGLGRISVGEHVPDMHEALVQSQYEAGKRGEVRSCCSPVGFRKLCSFSGPQFALAMNLKSDVQLVESMTKS